MVDKVGGLPSGPLSGAKVGRLPPPPSGGPGPPGPTVGPAPARFACGGLPSGPLAVNRYGGVDTRASPAGRWAASSPPPPARWLRPAAGRALRLRGLPLGVGRRPPSGFVAAPLAGWPFPLARLRSGRPAGRPCFGPPARRPGLLPSLPPRPLSAAFPLLALGLAVRSGLGLLRGRLPPCCGPAGLAPPPPVPGAAGPLCGPFLRPGPRAVRVMCCEGSHHQFSVTFPSISLSGKNKAKIPRPTRSGKGQAGRQWPPLPGRPRAWRDVNIVGCGSRPPQPAQKKGHKARKEEKNGD